MPSTNVIGFTLVLFLKQEVIKHHQIFMLWRQFFRVGHVVCRFIKITLNWLFGTRLFDFLPVRLSQGFPTWGTFAYLKGFI